MAFKNAKKVGKVAPASNNVLRFVRKNGDVMEVKANRKGGTKGRRFCKVGAKKKTTRKSVSESVYIKSLRKSKAGSKRGRTTRRRVRRSGRCC